MSRILYLTYADQPSGVFSSQVCDVVNYLNGSHRAGVRLVAFVSLRGYRTSCRRIKSEVRNAIVLPMLPKANYWKCSFPLLALVCMLTRSRSILARGVLACNLALLCRQWGIIKKAGYDGRGAIAAEWAEYDVVPYANLKNSIDRLEAGAVRNSDFRISVSQKLVEYWRERYGYDSEKHVVIPCLINSSFKHQNREETERKALRAQQGIKQDSVVLVYSGSVSGWQSFGLVKSALEPLLRSNRSMVLVFMSPPDQHIDEMKATFPEQVFRVWVNHREVSAWLSACDYGVLIREPSVTNRVASPTKFAEYLIAGLPVIISEGIGDYSDFVREHDCGVVVAAGESLNQLPAIACSSDYLKSLAMKFFTKESQADRYKQVIDSMKF